MHASCATAVQLIGIFALSFVTMWCGMLTELFSRPNSDEKDGWQKPYYECAAAMLPVPKRRCNAKLPRTHARRRMLPHFLGFFPYAAAWFIIIQTYKDQLDDMCDELRKKVPPFVDPIVYGSVAVFSSFALVQLVYQKRNSKYYWQTELWYCLLSVRACVHATHRRPQSTRSRRVALARAADEQTVAWLLLACLRAVQGQL